MRNFASLTLLLALTLPASPVKADEPLTADSVLTLSSYEEIFQASTAKTVQLTRLLEQVIDANSAQQLRPQAQRLYVEMQMMAVRASMLPEPTDNQMAQAGALREEYERGKDRLIRQCARISKSAALNHELQSVVKPIYPQDKRYRAAAASALLSQMQALRTFIAGYKLQHGESLPDFKTHGWKPLTQRTTAAGKFDDKGQFGPYARSSARNPLNGQSGILVVASAPKPDFEDPDYDHGYVFDQSTGRIWALDADGRIFDEESAAQANIR